MGRSPQARLQNLGPGTLRDGLVFDMHGLGLGTALMQPFFSVSLFTSLLHLRPHPMPSHPMHCAAAKTGAAENELVPYEVSLFQRLLHCGNSI